VALRAEADEVPYDPAVATSDIVRQSTLALIDALETVVHGLPAGSPIAAVPTDDYLEKRERGSRLSPISSRRSGRRCSAGRSPHGALTRSRCSTAMSG